MQSDITPRDTVNFLRVLAVAALCLLAGLAVQAQSQPTNEQIKQKVEAYVRHVYALGPEVKLTVGPLQESGVPSLYQTTVDVTRGEGHQSASLYVSKDGRYLFQGEMSDMTKDPLVDTRAKLDIKDAPSLGDPKAPVTIVEFADFECPICRNLHDAMRQLLPSYPQARLIFKDYPIDQIHPWARTAALGARCAYMQDPKAFWKMYDHIYDAQDLITAENVYSKVMDYAGEAGLNIENLKSCMAGSEATAAIEASLANGKSLDVASTPTLFINGRRIVGVDPHLIEQYIQYELAQGKSAKQSASN